jgi:hypothetical protein
MSTKIYIDLEGNLQGLADDTLDKLNSLGSKYVERVSNIEYDHTHECWVAVDMDGCVIAKNPIRSAVIDAERNYFNRKIENSFAR